MDDMASEKLDWTLIALFNPEKMFQDTNKCLCKQVFEIKFKMLLKSYYVKSGFLCVCVWDETIDEIILRDELS